MSFEESSKENVSGIYADLVQAEINNNTINRKEAIKNIELVLFEERISQFIESDLVQDSDGSWSTFEKKVRDVFPELPEDRFRAFKAAVSMELCGL